MRIVERNLEFGKSKTANVNFTACWHIGHQAMHEEGLDLMLKGFKKKKEPWVQMGDVIEAIMPYDPRFAVDEHKVTLNNEIECATDKVSMAAETCWGILVGNHEAKASRQVGDITETICNGVKRGTGVQIEHLSNTCFMDIVCPDGSSKGFFAHGAMTANYRSGDAGKIEENRKTKLRNYLRKFEADLKGIAHGHREIIAEPMDEEKLGVRGDKSKRRPVAVIEPWCFAAPSMFKVYDEGASMGNYAEMQLYDPTDLGWIQVVYERDGYIPCIRLMLEDGSVKKEIVPRIVS